MSIQKVAISNRGEIAVRIIRSLKEMGIPSVLLHSAEDRHSMACRNADETLCIGSGLAYLDVKASIEGVKSSGASALHPGVGFLSEAKELAEACEKEGIIFIGPNFKQLKLFGDKIESLKYVHSLGIPTIPSYFLDEQDESVVLQQISKLNFPVMIKLSQGGGGVGLKKVENKNTFLEDLKSIKRIGQSVFNSNRFYVESFLKDAKHIEVQVFGDFMGDIHLLGERDCSIQVRNQKVIEEAPTSLSSHMLETLQVASKKIAKSIQYKQAGTIEFLVKENQYYFLEMNTRLQVEHAVTEELFKIDLVEAQIQTSFQRPVSFNLKSSKHVMECRIYAQDKNKIPQSGSLASIKLPSYPNVRYDFGYESYDHIPSLYDSLIGKVIVKDSSRTKVLDRMIQVLNDLIIFGVTTNIPLLKETLKDEQYKNNNFNLSFQAKQRYYTPSIPKEYISIIRSKAQKQDKDKGFNPWTHEW